MFQINQDNIKNMLFAAMATLALFFLVQMKAIALLAFGSFVLACSLRPAVDKLSSKMKRSFASMIVIILTLLIVVLFLIPIVTISINEIHSFVHKIPQIIDNAVNYASNTEILGRKIIEFIDINEVASKSSDVAGGILDKSINFTIAILDIVTVIITMGVIIFYILNERNLIRDAVILVFPPQFKEKAKEVYEIIEQKVGGYVMAQILAMSSVAILTSFGLIVLKIEYAVLLGFIAGILDIVPIIGPVIALILGIICASQQGFGVVILTAIVYLAAQWASNNLVRPLVFGKFLDLHPIIIIFSFLIAAQFLGVWGVILSPAIAALLLTLFEELYVKPINSENYEYYEE